MDDRMVTPRAPRRRARASLSMATPPSNLTGNRTPFSTVGDSGERRRGRASLSMVTSPLAMSGATSAGAAGAEQGPDGSPWLGGRAESPSTGNSPLPSTRGEMNHFRRAEELWKKASKAREGSRRRTMGAAPTLKQRMAWRREEEEKEEEELKGEDEGGEPRRRRRQWLRNGRPEQDQQQLERSSSGTLPPPPTPHEQRDGQKDEPLQQQQQQRHAGEGVGGGEVEGGGVRTGGGGGVGVGVRPPRTPARQRAARVHGGPVAVGALPERGGGVLGQERGDPSDGRGGAGAQGATGGVRGEKDVGGKDELDRAAVRAKVLAIYEEHNKEKIHTVDEALDKYEGRWAVMLQRLEEKYISASGLPPASGNGPLCFMDMEVGGDPVGRLVFRLFADKTPKAAENFRSLCTGEKGRGLRYEGSAFHRIIPGFVVQGGDFTTGDGRGGKSIYGDKFEDEPFMRHHKLGLLSMANKGANTNNSQFFITLKAVAHLDGKHVVFGEVQSGIKVLDRMKSVTLVEPKKDGKPAPDQRVVIARCGQLNEDGTEVQRAAAPRASTPPASAPLFGRPSNLGDPSTTTGSIFGTGATADAAAAATATGVRSSFPWGRSSGASVPAGFGGSASAQGVGGSSSSGFGSGAGGLFGSASTPAVPALFGQPTSAGATAAAAAPLATPEKGGTKNDGGSAHSSSGSGLFGGDPATSRLPGTPSVMTVASSFGSLAAAVAAGPPGLSKRAPAASAVPAATASSPVAGSESKDGVSTPTSRTSYFTTPPSDLAAVAVRVAALTPPSGGRRSSGPRPPGGAAGAAFDRLDEAGTGWVGQDEFEVLVGSAGLPFEADEHGRALLELCSPRLPRDRFLAWYAAARKAQREAGGGSAVKQDQAGTAVGSSSSISGGGGGGGGSESKAATVDASSDVQDKSSTAVVPQEASPGSPKIDPPMPDSPKKEDNDGALGGDNASGDSSDGSGDEEERREERAKAEAAFDKVDSAAKGWMEEKQFEALMEAVGTTYSVEDHRPKLLSVCRESRLERVAFLSWYDDWLFGDDASSDEEEEDGEKTNASAAGRAPKTTGFASLLKSQAGGWKCDACLVSNPESAVKCLSCEAVKPGEEGKVEAAAASGGGILGVSSGGSTGGFTFGAPVAAVTANETAAVSPIVETNAEGGFTFGAPLAASAPPSAAVVPSGPSAGTNASGGFTFGTPVPESSPSMKNTEPAPAVASVDAAEAGAAASDSSDESDSGDEEERLEERAKAEGAFDKVDSAAKGWLEENQFEALMEAVGTTYSVEDHRPKLLSICRENRLERVAFLSWYDDWLFGDDDSSDEEGQDDGATSRESAKGGGFASLLKSQAGGWKCDACLVSNPESTVKCLSCEAVRPGEEGKVADSVAAGGTAVEGSNGGASTGGFTFGAPVAAETAVETTAAVSCSVETNAEGGFTFGGPAAAAAPAPAAVVPSMPSAGSNASGGFTFGAPAPESPMLPNDIEDTAVVASVDGVDADAAAAADSCGDSDSSGDEEERREERAKAEAAFDKVDSAAKGWLEENQFEALMEAVGTTYSVEDHRPKLLSICRENRLERVAFLSWYDDWLFGDDDSSDEEGQDDGATSRESAKGGGFASLLKSQAGGWKCDACLVSNPESAMKCLSCEAVRPGEEGKVADSVAAGGTAVEGSNGGASTGGFTFGAPVAAETAVETTATVSCSVETNAEGGFTFGGPAAATASASAAVVPSMPSAGTNSSGGFTFGAPVSESSASAPNTEPAAAAGEGAGAGAPAGENVVGEPAAAFGSNAAGDLELGSDSPTGGFALGSPSAGAAVVGAKAVIISSDASVDDSDNGSSAGSSSTDDSGDEEEERREEKAKAETAFTGVDGNAKGWVGESQFEALMEGVGTTYSVEDHRPKLLSICADGRLEREAFVTWYIDWLFGPEEDSSDEYGGEGDRGSANGAGQTAAVAGFASLLKSQAGGWKCDACLVSNPESAVKCLSCEAVKPGEEGKVEAAAASGGGNFGVSSGGSTGGFTFGAPVAPAVATTTETAAVSSGVATNAEGGFTFGAPLAAAAPAPAAVVPSVPSAGTNASGGFTFGTPVPESSASASDTERPATVASIGGADADAAPAADSCGDSDSSGDEEERREERAKAEAAFDKVDSAAKGWLEENQFEALMEAVGTTYSVEDHRPKLLSICRENRLERVAFLSWYDDWLFGDDDSSDENGEEERVDNVGGQVNVGFASLLKSQAGGWKCDACLVSNPESAMKCLSCEAVRPGEEGKVADSVAAGGTAVEGSNGGASTGGFTFGAPVAAETAVETTAAVSCSVETNAEGGFTFGGPAAATASASAAAVPSMPSAGTNASGGFTFGAPVSKSSASAPNTEPATAVAHIDGAEEERAAGGIPSTFGSPKRRFTFASPTRLGKPVLGGATGGDGNKGDDGGAAAPGGKGGEGGGRSRAFGTFISPPRPVRKLAREGGGGGGHLFGPGSSKAEREDQGGAAAGSGPQAEGILSPRALENLTPRTRARRRASASVTRGRRSSVGPAAAGQRKKLPIGGVGGGTSAGLTSTAGVVDAGAADALPAAAQEEAEGPSLFGGEPKIF